MKLKFIVNIDISVQDKDAVKLNNHIKEIGEEKFIYFAEKQMKDDIIKELGYKETDEDCIVTVKGSVE